MHYNVLLAGIVIFPLVIVVVVVVVGGIGGIGGIGGGSGGSDGGGGGVVIRGSNGRSNLRRRGPAHDFITEKNFIKGEFDSRTRNTERIVGSRGVEPFAIVHGVRQSRRSI